MKRNYRNRSNLQVQPANRQPRLRRSSDVIGCAIKGVMEILSLPPEIIWLILIRLSVESLSAMKCVCKYFSRVISSPKFVTAHLKFSTEDASMSGYRVIVNLPDSESDSESHSKLKQTSVQSLITESKPSRTLVDLFYPKFESHCRVELLGSCNGIVFMIVDQRHRFLWNPATKVYHKLPCIGKRLNRGVEGRFSAVNYGLGFDKSNDDYKLVVLISFGPLDYVVNVFRSKRGTWKKLPDFSGVQLRHIDFGKFASGHLHWSTAQGDIVSFDVEKEVFGTLEQPNNWSGVYDLALNVFGGSISVSYLNTSQVDVWVMKEYGIVKSWTKMFSLPGHSMPLSILPNGEVVLDNGYLDIYNLADEKVRWIRIRQSSDPIFYVESLDSPFDKKK